MNDSEFGQIDWAAYYAREGDVYAGREDADTLHRCRAVWNVFPRSGVRSYADIGCGEGLLPHWIASRTKLDRVVGADLSQPRLARARALYPNVEYLPGDVSKLPFADGEFDIVSCVETLEHQERPEAALRELARVAAKYVLVMVPDRQEVEKTLCPHCLKVFPLRGHIHTFDIARLRKLAEGAGMTVRKYKGYHPAYHPSSFLLRCVAAAQYVLKPPAHDIYLACLMAKPGAP